MTSRRPWGVASVCAAGLFLTACSGGSAETTQVTASEPAAAEQPAVATTSPVPVQAAPAPTEAEPASGQTQAEPSAPSADVEPQAQAAVEPADEPQAVAEAAVAVDLPAVQVVDLATGEPAELTSFSRPGVTLVWFWAPH